MDDSADPSAVGSGEAASPALGSGSPGPLPSTSGPLTLFPSVPQPEDGGASASYPGPPRAKPAFAPLTGPIVPIADAPPGMAPTSSDTGEREPGYFGRIGAAMTEPFNGIAQDPTFLGYTMPSWAQPITQDITALTRPGLGVQSILYGASAALGLPPHAISDMLPAFMVPEVPRHAERAPTAREAPPEAVAPPVPDRAPDAIDRATIRTSGAEEPESDLPFHDRLADFDAFRQSTGQTGNDALSLNNAARDYVIERQHETGAEHIAAYDADTKAVTHAGTSLSPGQSLIPEDLVEGLRDPNRNITLHHSHPDNSALSGADAYLLGFPGTRWVVAHGSDGELSAARLTPEAKAALAKRMEVDPYGVAESLKSLSDEGQTPPSTSKMKPSIGATSPSMKGTGFGRRSPTAPLPAPVSSTMWHRLICRIYR